MVSILIDVLWRDKYTLRTSGFSVAGGPDAVIAWDNETRTFSIEPYDPGYEGYVPRFAFYAWSRTADYQRKYEKEEIVLPDEEGLFVIYYSSNDETRTQVLNYLKNPTAEQLKLIYEEKVIVSWIYWSYNAQSAIYFGDSRHGSEWNPQMHWTWHQTFNSVRQSGLAFDGITFEGDGTSDDDYVFGISAGELWHEDIFAETAAVGVYDELPVWYIDETGNPVYGTAPGKKFLNFGPGRIAVNPGNGLGEVPNLQFAVYHYFATNCRLNSHIAVMGKAAHETLGSAITSIEAEVATLRQQLPHSNLMYIGSVVFQTSDDYTNAGKARVVYIATDEDVFVTDTDFDPDTGILTLFRSANRPPLLQPLDLSTIIHNQIINEGDTIINIVNEGDIITVINEGSPEVVLNNKPDEYTLRVYLNGVRQHPNSYSVVDKTVVFNEAPWPGDLVKVFYEIYKPSEDIGGEVPAGAFDGSNQDFTLAETPDPASVNVYLNGILQASSAYVINGNVVTLTEAPYPDDYIIIDYKTHSAPVNAGYNQSPAGLVNGANTIFTLPVEPTRVMVYLNGVRQLENTHFTFAGDTITFAEAPFAGDWIIVDYTL